MFSSRPRRNSERRGTEPLAVPLSQIATVIRTEPIAGWPLKEVDVWKMRPERSGDWVKETTYVGEQGAELHQQARLQPEAEKTTCAPTPTRIECAR